jgi:hypothetical protein
MKGTYPVANRLTIEAATTAGRAHCSPERYDRIKDVATFHITMLTRGDRKQK